MNSEIVRLDFSQPAVAALTLHAGRHSNWPVVYVLEERHGTVLGAPNGLRDIYVGESLNTVARMRQHLKSPQKQHLSTIRVIVDATFNKSVCLDLESYLIQMLAGDGAYRVLNRNDGITRSNYYERDRYREGFRNVFVKLAQDGVFTRSIPAIENSDLFRLSPFKALTEDQANSVEQIVKGFLTDLVRGVQSTIVIQGDPGTGKTVVAIFMMKLLLDIKTFTSLEDLDPDSRFSEFFTEDNRQLLQGLRIALVVPQQSLRESIKKVFRKTPELHPSMVLTPFEVAEADGHFDLLLVDETHRLTQRANQSSGGLNTKVTNITINLFSSDDTSKTQLDWIQAKSQHQIFLLDPAQSVRPADLPTELLSTLAGEALESGRYFQLQTQMRVQAGSYFVSYIRGILNPNRLLVPHVMPNFGDYDFRAFDSVEDMRDEIFQRDAEAGLSRLVAGYAWEWTKKDKNALNITIGQTRLKWNTTSTDWIASENSLEEVGSIHTVQGYDLNYVGVIIGLDLRYSMEQQRLWVSRASYFDKKGKEQNRKLGRSYSDEDLLRFITQIYAVLLTRGIRGTYVYVCDPGLREYLKGFIPSSPHRHVVV